MSGSVFYACPSCISFSAKFQASLGKLDKRVEAVETTAKGHETRIMATDTKVEALEGALKKVKEELEKVKCTGGGGGDGEQLTRAVFTEMAARKSNESVVILHGMSEPDANIKKIEESKAADIA